MRLLILDINGLLCCKISKNSTNLEVLKLGFYDVILRPYCREFLDYCFDNFTVAFYSSTTYKNANIILDKLLTSTQKSQCLFRWFRDRTRLDPDYGKIKGITPFDTIKLLKDVFENASLNEDRRITENNTVICDDSMRKMRFNSSDNVIIFEEFKGNSTDNHLKEMIRKIETKFYVLKFNSN